MKMKRKGMLRCNNIEEVGGYSFSPGINYLDDGYLHNFTFVRSTRDIVC